MTLESERKYNGQDRGQAREISIVNFVSLYPKIFPLEFGLNVVCNYQKFYSLFSDRNCSKGDSQKVIGTKRLE